MPRLFGHFLPVFWRLIVTGVLFLVLGVAPALADSSFEPWDNRVFVAVGERYGEDAAERLRRVHNLILEGQNKPVLVKLKLVNDLLNKFPWMADQALWNLDDYWAAPFETITTNGGDCEDLAIAKYWVLRMMGVPDEKLGLAYVQTDNLRHMVLLYLDAPDGNSLILDNLHPDVMPFAERRDIIAIYLLQNDGTFYLIEDDGIHTRRFKARYHVRNLSKWTRSMEREETFNQLYVQYNNGRPLFPHN